MDINAYNTRWKNSCSTDDLALQTKLSPIVTVSRDGSLPLSFAQERLWFLDQLEPDNVFYNVPIALCLRGPLDVRALDKSINEILRRHEVLRMTFVEYNGKPELNANMPRTIVLHILDIRNLAETEREIEASRLITEEAYRPFALTQAPLFRVKLLWLSEENYILMLNTHHIVFDGWSLGVFIRELTTLYRAFSVGNSSPLPDLPIQYADYAVWQRQNIQGEKLDKQLSYWQQQQMKDGAMEKQLEYLKQQLGSSLSMLQFPNSRHRTSEVGVHTLCQTLAIAGNLYKALKKMSYREGCTLFMTLLSAFKALLYCYTGQEDIRVGTVVANRNRREFENAIGLFINTLILRTSLVGDPTFRELMKRIRDTTLASYACQDLPFEKLVQTLEHQCGIKRTSLFQVMFIFQNIPQPSSDLLGLPWVSQKIAQDLTDPNIGVTTYDLVFVFAEKSDILKGSLIYRADLFDADIIGQMLENFRNLLELATLEPDLELSTLRARICVD